MSADNLTHCWLIWSNEHKGWWKANNHGYTTDRLKARRFTCEEAVQTCHSSNHHRWFRLNEPFETMVPLASLPEYL